MKLQLSIPTRPRLIHMLPVLDLVALVLAVPLLIKQFAPVGGQTIVLAESRFRVPAVEHALVIEVKNGAELQIYVGPDAVHLEDLPTVLKEKKVQWTHGGKPVVLLKIDQFITNGQRMEIENQLLNLGFRVIEVGNYKSR